MSAILAARKSEQDLNGPLFDPRAFGGVCARAILWLRTLFVANPARTLPPHLLRDAGLAAAPGVDGRAWADVDRRRRLPL